MAQRNAFEELALLQQQVDLNARIVIKDSKLMIAHTKQLLGETQEENAEENSGRIFQMIKYSTKYQAFKTKFFIEDEKYERRNDSSGIAYKYNTTKLTPPRLNFFSNLTNDLGSLHLSSHCNSISLAVIGGNHFRRMLGQTLPKHYLALDIHDTSHKRNYRFSSEVDNFIEWGNYKTLQDYPIYGFIIILVLAYYFADFDVGLNFGVIQENDYYKVSKIDPEHCYGDDFEKESLEDVFESLSFLFNSVESYKPEEMAKYNDVPDDEEKVFMIFGENTPTFFQIALDCAPFQSIELFQRLFFSPQRNRELFIALAIILDTEPSELKEDVDSVLGPEDSWFKRDILYYQQQRYQFFKQAAFELEGFVDYYLRRSYLEDPIYQIYKPANQFSLQPRLF